VGRLKKGDRFARTFIFRVPGEASSLEGRTLVFEADDTTVFVNEGEHDREWHGGRDGGRGRDHGRGRGDTFHPGTDRVATLVKAPSDTGGRSDYFGTYTLPGGGTWGTNRSDIEMDTTLLDSVNTQGTKVTVPATAGGTNTVLQELVDGQCPPGKDCFGDTSRVTVPSFFAGYLRIFVRWNRADLPADVTKHTLRVAWNPSETAGGWLLIDEICNASVSNLPCRHPVVKFSDGDLGVAIKVPHNGLIKGLR
jgi:hypothetical protein